MSDSAPPHGVVKIALPAAVVTAAITALATGTIMHATTSPASAASPEVTAKEFKALQDDVREVRSDIKAILLRLGEIRDNRNNARAVEGTER